MPVQHCKRVNSFPHLLRRLLNETRIWDSVYVSTDVEGILPKTFSDGVTEWFLYVHVHYIDEDGEEVMTSFLYQTTNWEWLIEMEEQSRKIIPAIFA